MKAGYDRVAHRYRLRRYDEIVVPGVTRWMDLRAVLVGVVRREQELA